MSFPSGIPGVPYGCSRLRDFKTSRPQDPRLKTFPSAKSAIVDLVCSIRFRALCSVPLESCQVRKEAALRGQGWVPQVARNLINATRNVLSRFAGERLRPLSSDVLQRKLDSLQHLISRCRTRLLLVNGGHKTSKRWWDRMWSRELFRMP